jgi:hypothetical protein
MRFAGSTKDYAIEIRYKSESHAASEASGQYGHCTRSDAGATKAPFHILRTLLSAIGLSRYIQRPSGASMFAETQDLSHPVHISFVACHCISPLARHESVARHKRLARNARLERNARRCSNGTPRSVIRLLEAHPTAMGSDTCAHP